MDYKKLDEIVAELEQKHLKTVSKSKESGKILALTQAYRIHKHKLGETSVGDEPNSENADCAISDVVFSEARAEVCECGDTMTTEAKNYHKCKCGKSRLTSQT